MDYEKLGLFYLGRTVDPTTRQRSDTPLLYEAADLLTHAVIIGMTGSGKTGLGIAVIEEAAIDGVPVLALDVKGDLANLALTFPRLAPEEFAPWVNPDEARARQLSADAFATEEARRWAAGLAEWDQDASRIARLQAAADVAVYTPGSRAGRPLSVLSALDCPPAAILDDPELLAARVQSVARSVLALAGIGSEATTGRETVLVGILLQEAWSRGESLDLAGLISRVQTPTVTRIGVLDLEAFFPAADRFALALRLNALLAAPGFATWLDGEPLDVGRLLYTDEGRPRIAVVSVAHLDDQQRMFVVALLLEQLLAWMRTQRGTTSLRALFYMDELFGYLPPTAQPPSKTPLLTLMKQARAFGLGCVLSTQNPVDLDYKALANAGTWCLGRLQTERDKARVLDGLEGVAAGSSAGLTRSALDAQLSSLEKRVFLLHNVHRPAPQLFQTRWTLSYLRGPLGRDELKRLPQAAHAAPTVPAAALPVSAATSAVAAAAVPAAPARSAATAPAPPPPVLLPPDVPQFTTPGDADEWTPMLLGAARLTYSSATYGIDTTREVVMLTPIADGAVAVDWDDARPAGFTLAALHAGTPTRGTRHAVPAPASRPRNYSDWSKAFLQWAARTQTLDLLQAPAVSLVSGADETERDFRLRVQMASRERRDAALQKVQAKYAPKLAALDDKVRRAEATVARETQQAGDQKLQTAVSIGATLLGAFMGRRAMSASTLGRATTAARGVSRMGREAQDVVRAEASRDAVQQQRDMLAAALEDELAAVQAAHDDAALPFTPLSLKPARGGVDVRLVALVWVPAI